MVKINKTIFSDREYHISISYTPIFKKCGVFYPRNMWASFYWKPHIKGIYYKIYNYDWTPCKS